MQLDVINTMQAINLGKWKIFKLIMNFISPRENNTFL